MLSFNDSKKKMKKFQNAMSFAEELLGRSPRLNKNHPILDLVRLVGKSIQTEYLTHMLYSDEPRSSLPDAYFDEFGFDISENLSKDGKNLYDVINKIDIESNIYLSKDLILPWPWNRDRLTKSMAFIGQERKWGPWRQDDNHRIELWLPLGISWVEAGNHSIAAGIIQGQGQIKPDRVYDISNIYNYVMCDGGNYIRKEDNSIIAPVKKIEMAVLFEIGRIMRDNSISF